MSRVVRFTKMSGAGNDFVVIDNRGAVLRDPLSPLIRTMCQRKRGIGADGLIVIEPPKGAEDFSMRYYNSDGTEADLCGNGARCVALFANRKAIAGKVMRFSSSTGQHSATVTEEGVKVTMPKPADGPRRIEVPLGGGRSSALYVVVGVPHTVILVHDVAAVDAVVDGRRVRSDPAVGPEGTNVDFVQVIDSNRILLRTYERGVEEETLACGTGAVASAVATCTEGLTSSPVAVETSGGDILRVHGADGRDDFGALELEGPACVVYEGVWSAQMRPCEA